MIDLIHTKIDYLIFMKKFLLLIAMVVGAISLTSCSIDDDDDDTSVSYEENLKEGQKFLENNAKREGIITTKSGLQYEVVKEGDGERPSATDTVKCHYEGCLIDGKIFDSSYNRNTPSTFTLDEVIPGWTEGLQLMKAGSIYRFYIPYDLAYGSQKVSIIKPYSTLIFYIELLEVKKKKDKSKE